MLNASNMSGSLIAAFAFAGEAGQPWADEHGRASTHSRPVRPADCTRPYTSQHNSVV